MPSAKSHFPMPFSPRGRSLITVGGSLNNKPIKEVCCYAIAKNAWTFLPLLPVALDSSAAIVLDPDHLYNVGGFMAIKSVYLLKLGKAKDWVGLDVESVSFAGWHFRDVALI